MWKIRKIIYGLATLKKGEEDPFKGTVQEEEKKEEEKEEEKVEEKEEEMSVEETIQFDAGASSGVREILYHPKICLGVVSI